MENPGGFVINRGFFRIHLSRLRLIKFDLALNIVRKMDYIRIIFKYSLVCEAEAYIGRLFQSREVRVSLIKADLKFSVCTKVKRSIHLIGLALVHDVDLHRSGLLFNDPDTRRHLISEDTAIIKLIG